MVTGRNQPCPCGSSKKFKRCCGKTVAAQPNNILETKTTPSPHLQPLQTDLSCYLPTDTGLWISVPDSIELITPYVLREQLHWFEKEVDFVKKILKPGENVLDIGANYGLYALGIAQIIGKEGHLWAFEPTAKTADHLRASILKNNLNQVTLIQSALSSQPGMAKLQLNNNCEMNSLSNQQIADGKFEEVQVDTLDNCSIKQQWPAIDFIKLDAEGEETRILEGGESLLKQHSPLIMFEIKHGEHLNHDLIQTLESMGFQCYRLVPGLCALALFDQDILDHYELNLFGCKPDKATKLAYQNRLISASPALDSIDSIHAAVLNPDIGKAILELFAYARLLWPSAEKISGLERNSETKTHLLALQLHRQAHDETLSIDLRYQSLKGAWEKMESLGDVSTNLPRLCTQVRLAGELGKRALEIELIGKAIRLLQQQKNILIEEPFLPACPRFDAINPKANLSQWLISSLLEQLELQEFFSSYYSGAQSLNNLELLKKLGFQSEEMERRRLLIRQRFQIP